MIGYCHTEEILLKHFMCFKNRKLSKHIKETVYKIMSYLIIRMENNFQKL